MPFMARSWPAVSALAWPLVLVTWQRQPVDQPAPNRQAEGFSAPEGKPAVTSLRPPCLAGPVRKFFSKIILKKSGLRDGVGVGQAPQGDGTQAKNFISEISLSGNAFRGRFKHITGTPDPFPWMSPLWAVAAL